jgi:hypothetical protein
VFYYSGHGLQIPGLGANGEIDHVEDGKVPVDFDWQKLNTITDKDLFALYSQLPEEARFLAIFDCCFSGGLIKGPRGPVRNLPVPDEIRHAVQAWDSQNRRWMPWELKKLLPGLDQDKQEAYVGLNGFTYKIGRAIPLRRVSEAEFQEVTKLRKHKGPYLPVVMEACRDDQLSYEHANGAVTNGAFTFSLVSEFKGPNLLTFKKLGAQVTKSLKELGVDQQPQIVGPKKILNRPVAQWDQGGGGNGCARGTGSPRGTPPE